MAQPGKLACWQRVMLSVLALLLLGIAVVLALLFIVLIRAGLASQTNDPDFSNTPAQIILDDGKQMERANRLANALKIPTVSVEIGKQNLSAILELHDYLQQSFPLVHSSGFVQRTVVNKYSLLYKVTGSDNGDKLPYMLAAHLDVVPANPDTWEVAPFSGQIVNDTFIYGRGAIDNKSGVLGILEALEFMLSQDERPKRTFFLAFGHDEELGGKDGAQEIAKELQVQGGSSIDFVLDEGYTASKGVMPGTQEPIALVGVTEKGMLYLELTVNGTRGHSSFPPEDSAIGILSAAVARLEKHKIPSMLGYGVERYMFEYLAPHVKFGYRVFYSNLWLFSSLISSIAEKNPIMNALMRTTTAVTVFKGGDKGNIVPGFALAVVNHRIHPSQRVAEVIEFDRKVINDPRVQLTPKIMREAAPVTPFGPDASRFQLIARTITQTLKTTVVVPSVLIANTDTKWYWHLTSHIFRFFPTTLGPQDTERYHGDNERISVQDYNRAVQFYYSLIKNADVE